MTDLLRRGAPHTCQVQKRESTKDAGGRTRMVNVGDPITVRGMAEPVRDWSSAEESHDLGLQVIDLIMWRSKTWPGDVHSHVIYDGGVYETIGNPQHHHVSKRTSHWRVTLRWIEAV